VEAESGAIRARRCPGARSRAGRRQPFSAAEPGSAAGAGGELRQFDLVSAAAEEGAGRCSFSRARRSRSLCLSSLSLSLIPDVLYASLFYNFVNSFFFVKKNLFEFSRLIYFYFLVKYFTNLNDNI